MDIRTKRTRTMLFEAFEGLLEAKPLEDISVVELCERSTVRRATFYRNFEDKYDFHQQYLQSITERFMAELQLVAEDDDLITYAKKMHTALIAYLDEHPKITKNSFSTASLTANLDSLMVQVADGIISFARKDCERLGLELPMPADFFGLYYAGGLVQTLRWWILNDRPISASKLVDYCAVFIEQCFAGKAA